MRTLLLMNMVLALFGMNLNAQVPAPGEAIEGRLLIRYATIHVGNGTVIQNGYVEVQNGEFSLVADANSSRIDISKYDSIIDADGKHLYPGFTIMDSRLGLTEIGAVKATHDYDETGEFLPNVRSLPAFNTESKIISTVRTNGVLMAQIAPVGGKISGSSSMVHFDGWEWQDAAISADEGVFLNWPNRYRHTGWWGEPGKAKNNKKYDDEVDELYDYMRLSQAYAEQDSHEVKNLRLVAMSALFKDNKRLYIRVDAAKDILDVVQFVRTLKIDRVAIVGGSEAHLVGTELKENSIPVVIDRVHKLPKHIDSPIEEPFKMAALLQEADLEIAFATQGSMEAMISRNLPFQVGTAVYHGLPYEEAIKALTLTPAKLMGVDEQYGSIESGKRATFFLSEGDALDIPTNKITLAFVEGRVIDLRNHQSELNEKFAKKLGVEP